MKSLPSQYQGLSTFLTHYTEGENPEHAHLPPIYQNSVFTFDDTESGASIASGERPGYYYTRLNNPNHQQLARKLAALEAWDLIRDLRRACFCFRYGRCHRRHFGLCAGR